MKTIWLSILVLILILSCQLHSAYAEVVIYNNGVKVGTAIELNCGPDGSVTCACQGKTCTIKLT